MKTKKITIRDRIRTEIIHATSRLYAAKNYERWNTTKVYGEQIQQTWKMAYTELSNQHPRMEWLKTMMATPSKDIELKLVLRVPGKDIEIDLPGGNDRKLSAIAHAGGKELLLELLEIIQDIK